MKKIRLVFVGLLSIIVSIGIVANNVLAVSSGPNHLADADDSNVQGNGPTGNADVSYDGHYIVFDSHASNLVPNDTNNRQDIFVRDTVSNTTSRVSIASDGTQSDDSSQNAHITPNGKFVVFESTASNLTSNYTGNTQEIFVRNLQAGTTELASVGSNGSSANASSSYASISANGRYVVFMSYATNLTSDSVQYGNVFVRDMVKGTTTLISKTSAGSVNDNVSNLSMSCDGAVIAFQSTATNLTSSNQTPGIDNIYVASRIGNGEILAVTTLNSSSSVAWRPNVSCDGNYISFSSNANLVSGSFGTVNKAYRYDLQDSSVSLVSSSINNAQANTSSEAASISGDGRYVSFFSDATNLGFANTSNSYQSYVKDMTNSSVTLVSKNSDGTVGNGFSGFGAISGNGKVVAYLTSSNNLISGGDFNGYAQDVMYSSVTE